MNVNQMYELKNSKEVYKYISNKHAYNNNTFSVTEIGNGNMNYVYRIKDFISDKSIILKYAAKHTRISEDILISTDRIKIEAQALTYLSGYVPNYVPQLYQYDKLNNCILMKDYNDFMILRDRLINFEQIPDFAENIVTYLVKSILPTSELILEEEVKKGLIDQFANPELCDITKTFVFTEPFCSQSSVNAVYEPNQDFIQQEIFQDNKLKSEVEKMKDIFTNKKQALLHGDLHTGSIFTNQSDVIVFDYEFAFIGPIGFDLGNLVSNLIFAWLHAEAFNQREDYLKWIEETIIKIVDLFIEKFLLELEHYKAQKTNDVSFGITSYLDEIIQDTASFAGIELIRRIVGIAHVSDITSINNEAKRIRAERIAIHTAKRYILSNKAIKNGSDFVKVIKEIAGQRNL